MAVRGPTCNLIQNPRVIFYMSEVWLRLSALGLGYLHGVSDEDIPRSATRRRNWLLTGIKVIDPKLHLCRFQKRDIISICYFGSCWIIYFQVLKIRIFWDPKRLYYLKTFRSSLLRSSCNLNVDVIYWLLYTFCRLLKQRTFCRLLRKKCHFWLWKLIRKKEKVSY